jgi:hypothetical protein
MTELQPSPPQRQGLVAELIGRLLTYMDRPWKAISIVVLLIVCGGGWFVWTERERMFGFLQNERPVVLNLGRMPAELSDLLIQTGADLVTVWSIDNALNTQDFVMSRVRGGGSWSLSPDVLPVIVADTNAKIMVEIYAGRVVCTDPRTRPTLLMYKFAEDGMQRVCVSRIPTTDGFVGALYVAWKNPLSPQREEGIYAAISAAANDMVKWRGP